MMNRRFESRRALYRERIARFISTRQDLPPNVIVTEEDDAEEEEEAEDEGEEDAQGEAEEVESDSDGAGDDVSSVSSGAEEDESDVEEENEVNEEDDEDDVRNESVVQGNDNDGAETDPSLTASGNPTTLTGTPMPTADISAQSELPTQEGQGRSMPLNAERAVIVVVSVMTTLLLVALFMFAQRKLRHCRETKDEMIETGLSIPPRSPSSATGTFWGGENRTTAQSIDPQPATHITNFISDDTSTVRDERLDHVRRSLLMSRERLNLERVQHPNPLAANPFVDPTEDELYHIPEQPGPALVARNNHSRATYNYI